MKPCRKCCKDFVPTSHQIKKKDFLCLPCRRDYEASWRAKRKEIGQPVISTKMPRAYHREYERNYYSSLEHRERRAALMRKYRNDPYLKFRQQARLAVRRALRSGLITKKPCEVCGDKRVQGHHPDYARPLFVKWLCIPHHVAEHAKAEGRGP